MTDEERAAVWDLGYDTAVTALEAATLRLHVEGEKSLKSFKRPANPYRAEARRS